MIGSWIKALPSCLAGTKFSFPFLAVLKAEKSFARGDSFIGKSLSFASFGCIGPGPLITFTKSCQSSDFTKASF